MNFKLSVVLSFLFLNSIRSDHITYKGLKYIFNIYFNLIIIFINLFIRLWYQRFNNKLYRCFKLQIITMYFQKKY